MPKRFRFLKKKENVKLKATVNGKSLKVIALKDFWKYIQLHRAYPIDVKLLEVHYFDKLHLLSSFVCSK
jgi:hypothetical protein